MKQISYFLIIAIICLLHTSCSNLFEERLDDLENRVDSIENLCEQMNTNISSLQTILASLEKRDYITDITYIKQNDKTIGYKITFSKSGEITIYSECSSVISAGQFNGVYYWMLNGEFILDQKGNKIKIVDSDSIVPTLRFENNRWLMSVDNGENWNDLGQVVKDSLFDDIVISETDVNFILTNGESISLKRFTPLSIEFDTKDLVFMDVNSTRDINYTVHSDAENIKMEVVSSADIKAKVIKTDDKSGAVRVTTGQALDEYSKVIIFVSDENQVIMRSISFEETALLIRDSAIKKISSDGGQVDLEFLSNIECQLIIPQDAMTWISTIGTKSLEQKSITINIAENQGRNREAKVIVQAIDSSLELEYVIKQEMNPDVRELVEREALIAFYKATGGDNWVRNDNWCSDKPLKEWYGVYIDDNEIVRGFNLDGNNLDGKITDELYNLTNLVYLNLFSNKITYIDVSKNDELSALDIRDNQLNEICLGYNYELNQLRCDNNKLESLNLVYCETLSELSCKGNNLKTLNFSNCKLLSHIDCDANQLVEVNVEGLSALRYLSCSYNQLKDINLTEYKELTSLFCRENKLESLYLSDNPAIEWIDCSSNRINMLKIENCEALSTLCCNNNNISTLDVFNCPKLKTLYCQSNQLESLDLNSQTELITLLCNFNKINTIDVSNCIKLEEFWCHQNKLTSLDVTANTNLKVLWCGNFKIEVDEGTGNYVGDNNLTEIDLSHNKLLEKFSCFGMSISSLDLSNNHLLKLLDCAYNTLKTLDISNNTNLEELYCNKCPNLRTIYISKGQQFTSKKDEHTEYVFKDSIYSSTDFSKDGEIIELQKASKGNGIDIVLLGDGFADIDIANGTYDNVMQKALEYLFSVEPTKSLKEYFNVYAINCISENQGIFMGANTVFSCEYGSGTLIKGNDERCIQYASTIPNAELSKMLITVILNDAKYAGTTYMYDNDLSIAYCPIVDGVTSSRFSEIIHHEAIGHGYAKLADEYYYDGTTIPQDLIDRYSTQKQKGWWANADFTNDPTSVSWTSFITDNRYSDENISVYEGAFTYEKGAYKATEYSIMNENIGGFNAPSRNAIYRRTKELAGENYSYDEFIAFDTPNRSNSTVSSLEKIVRKVHKHKFTPLHSPIILSYKP